MYDELEMLSDNYDSAEAAKPYSPPEPGIYIARITAAKFDHVGQNNVLKLCWKLEIVGGECQGDPVYINSSLSEAAARFLKGNLKTVGIPESTKLKDVPRLLPTVVGKVVEINVSKSGEYTNVDFKRLVSEGTADPNATAPEPERAPIEEPIPADDIPF